MSKAKELKENIINKINDFDATIEQVHGIKDASEYAYLRTDVLQYFDQLNHKTLEDVEELIRAFGKKVDMRYGAITNPTYADTIPYNLQKRDIQDLKDKLKTLKL